MVGVCAKTLFMVASLGCVEAQQLDDSSNGIPLREVLPANLDQIPVATRWSDRAQESLGKKAPLAFGDEYFSHRRPEQCDFPLEIVILQDLTDSFSDNIEEMKNVQLHQMIDGLRSAHPESRFSMVSFQDKAIFPLGDRDDYCIQFNSDFSTDLEPIYDAYAKAVSYGGADAPENHFGAILGALNSEKVSWSPINSSYARLIVVVTDAAPHHADDGANPVPAQLLPFVGPYTDAAYDDLCLHQYYPSAQQMYNAIVAKETYIAALVYDGDWDNGFAANGWKDFNKFLAQPAEFVWPTAEDSSDFWPQLNKVITALQALECVPSTTTTPAPTTTTTATTLPTTTTTATTLPATTTATTLPTTTTTATTLPATTPTTPLVSTEGSTQTTPPPVTTVATTTVPETTGGECPEQVIITDGVNPDCVPSADNCYCQPEVLVKLAGKPANLVVIANGQDLLPA